MRTNRGGRRPAPTDERARSRRRPAKRGAAAKLVVGSLVAVVCVLSGCGMNEDEKPSACEENEALCPTSSRLATDVACDCRCVAGYAGLTPTRAFEGVVSACLPPDLNPHTSPPDRREELDRIPSASLNQRVFKYCSENVASFLDDLIEQQQRPRDLRAVCMGPRIRCKCTTTGARDKTPACSSPCVDRDCDRENCLPLLKVGGGIEMAGCSCSRVNACGTVTPASSEPPICLNRVAAVLRRRVNRKTPPREGAGARRAPVRRQRLTTV
ncbi:MAG: hypothetical protein KF764_20595 [Labilithrix sp.]|nr:hypothetical protein [Labilithrix sp.]